MVQNPPPSLSVRQIADEARRHIRNATRALRSATTRTTGEVPVHRASAYALGDALLDLCPWCKQGLTKAANPPFCPTCHRDVLAWSEELQDERESQRKSIRAASKIENKAKELELLRKIREEGMVSRTRIRKATNRE